MRITHRFHPWLGVEFEVLQVRGRSGPIRVVFLDQTGMRQSVPIEWTSLVAPEPVLELAAGPSWFRAEALLRVVELLDLAR